MADMRFLKADYKRAKLRETQPLRYQAAQHPALGIGSRRAAFAGDYKHERQAVAVGALQETEQLAMGARLRHAVQVEPGIDLLPPARKLRTLAASKRRQRRRYRLCCPRNFG